MNKFHGSLCGTRKNEKVMLKLLQLLMFVLFIIEY